MSTPTTPARPPFPPFTRDSAMQKVRLAEDAWNTRDPAKVALAYAIDSRLEARHGSLKTGVEQPQQTLQEARETCLGSVKARSSCWP